MPQNTGPSRPYTFVLSKLQSPTNSNNVTFARRAAHFYSFELTQQPPKHIQNSNSNSNTPPLSLQLTFTTLHIQIPSLLKSLLTHRHTRPHSLQANLQKTVSEKWRKQLLLFQIRTKSFIPLTLRSFGFPIIFGTLLLLLMFCV